jgi:hypothetical protein
MIKELTITYLEEFENICLCYSRGLIGWGDFKYALEELNKTVDTNARIV